MKQLMKVVQQSEVFTVPSTKSPSGQLNKSRLVLQELGGEYENMYVADLTDKLAECRFEPGELVYAVLRFTVSEGHDQLFQNIRVVNLYRLSH